MITQEGKLEIFENFRFDGDLPKFWKNHQRGGGKRDESEVPTTMDEIMSKGDSIFAGNLTIHSTRLLASARNQRNWGNTWPQQNESMNVVGDSSGFTVSRVPVKGKGWWGKLKKFFKPTPKDPGMSIEDFFKSIKNSADELKVVEERLKGYKEALKKAEDSGQQALFDQISRTLVAVRAEAQLIAMRHPKFLEEATVVEFVKKAKKGLRLDWIANFTRVIPEDLVKLKLEFDDKDIFDNYVVLHYDPDKKSWAETQKEIEARREARRDPILFGVLEGRRRLYYVGDWVDDFCDLTMDQIADTLGKKALQYLE